MQATSIMHRTCCLPTSGSANAIATPSSHLCPLRRPQEGAHTSRRRHCCCRRHHQHLQFKKFRNIGGTKTLRDTARQIHLVGHHRAKRGPSELTIVGCHQVIRIFLCTVSQTLTLLYDLPSHIRKSKGIMASLDQVVAPNAYQRATETANYVRQQLPESLQNPKVAIVCGSGLGGLADTIEAEPKIALDYANIPNFPQSTGE